LLKAAPVVGAAEVPEVAAGMIPEDLAYLAWTARRMIIHARQFFTTDCPTASLQQPLMLN
jgi:hypothetical protein